MDLWFAFLVLICFSLPVTLELELELERVVPQGMSLNQLKLQDQRRHANFPLLGIPTPNFMNTTAFYFTKVKIGSPQREFSLLVDTGSAITWVSCIGFKTQRVTYNPRNSTSSSTISCSDRACKAIHHSKCSPHGSECPYELRYFDESLITGYFVSDIFHLDMVMAGSKSENHPASVIFGCTNHLSESSIQSSKSVDGLLGLGPDGISMFSQLSSQGAAPRVFSHCLKGGESGGGKLVLGEIQEPGMVYTPLDTSRNIYGVHLQNIAIDGQTVPIDPAVFASKDGGTFVDSGTTLAVLAEKAYDIFIPSLATVLLRSSQPVVTHRDQCFQVSNRIEEIFPNVSFNFKGGASMILTPKDYLITHFEDVQTWCIGFKKKKGSSTTILGDLVLKDKIIVYDLARKRVGWTVYNCSKSVNVLMTTHRSASSLLVGSLLKSILANIIAVFIYISMSG